MIIRSAQQSLIEELGQKGLEQLRRANRTENFAQIPLLCAVNTPNHSYHKTSK